MLFYKNVIYPSSSNNIFSKNVLYHIKLNKKCYSYRTNSKKIEYSQFFSFFTQNNFPNNPDFFHEFILIFKKLFQKKTFSNLIQFFPFFVLVVSFFWFFSFWQTKFFVLKNFDKKKFGVQKRLNFSLFPFWKKIFCEKEKKKTFFCFCSNFPNENNEIKKNHWKHWKQK